MIAYYVGIPTLTANSDIFTLHRQAHMDDESLVHGIPVKEWRQGFRPDMPEFAATRFLFTTESNSLVRIAFGNAGPFVDASGKRDAVFSHAVTLAPETAVELARALLKSFAEPVEQRKRHNKD